MRAFPASRRRRHVDQDAAAFDAGRKGGDLVRLEPGLAEAGAAMEFPSVPRTDDVILIEMAVAKRPADMIARIRQRTPDSIAKRECNIDRIDFAAAQGRPRQFVRGAEIDP